MKISLPAVVGLVVVAFTAGAFTFNSEAHSVAKSDENPSSVSSTPAPQRSEGGSVPISVAEARAMFRTFHKSTSSAGSQGVLRRADGTPIESIILENENVILPLKNAIERENKNFYGICAIPIEDPQTGGHSLMWMGLTHSGDSLSPELELFVPQGDTIHWPDFIYDHAKDCPDDCPTNHHILWE